MDKEGTDKGNVIPDIPTGPMAGGMSPFCTPLRA